MRTTPFFLVGWLLLFLSACQTSEQPEQIAYNTGFDEHLSGFTHGEISKHASIRVILQEAIGDPKNNAALKGLFVFQPALKGETVWSDEQTLEFVPEEPLQSGTIYTAKLAIDQLLPDLPDSLQTFAFQFKAKDQFINIEPMAAVIKRQEAGNAITLNGSLVLHDVEEDAAIEQVLKVYRGKEELPIIWDHQDGTNHLFSIKDLDQSTNAYKVTWKWNGAPIKSDLEGERQITVAGNANFEHLSTYHYETPEQQIVLEFSDVLDQNQNLDGLVQLNGNLPNYSIENNLIRIFTDGQLVGEKQIKISDDVVNVKGKRLGKTTSETITFSDIKPQVKWMGKGNIIPHSENMPVVFQSVNLNAVDVRIIKVRERNVKQFFQVNYIDGDRELKRVGDVVLEKRIELDQTTGLNLTQWTTHQLQLAELIQPEPGAIYEVAIGFRKRYSLYRCGTEDNREEDREEGAMLKMHKNWDSPNYGTSYWVSYEDDYEYEDLSNPCSRYYYRPNKAIKRNILASDLGVLAKQGDNGRLFVVNNLQTTKPLKGVELEFYDFHQQLIGTAKTNAEGMAMPELPKKPFFLIAKQGKQRGYLRLDDGSALSMSRFDVAGQTYHKGLKGYLYGERGVWRPGDALFLNFILEDKDKSLPANHPVVFTLRDPKGALVSKKTSIKGVGGLYNFTTQTNADAPTGNYLATVKVGGATFTRRLKVEAVKPNRLKIKLDFGTDALSVDDKDINGNLNATWLHGAIAKNLRAKVNVRLTETKTEFPGHSGYIFQDPVREFEAESKVVFEDKLDDKGNATVKTDLKVEEQSPGLLKATYLTKVFEPGGDFSIHQTSIPYYPYEVYIGIRMPKGDKRGMLLTDVDHTVDIVTVDRNGKPVDVKDLKLTLYKIDWKWWFDRSRDDLANYRGRVYGDEEQTATLTTVKGRAQWTLNVKEPKWGRFLLRVMNGDKGHATGKVFYMDWPGWAERASERDPAAATALHFSADKDQYNVGDKATLSIPTGYVGRALVTIENGSRILQANWIETQKGTTQFTIETTTEMAPNAYATVTLLQPHAQTKNDLPIRMYGVLPLAIEDPNTHLEPEVVMPDQLRPGEQFEVAVSEKSGGPMAYTVAIVDEGLLDLTNFSTPNPWKNFYKREALGVKTWDLYDEVLGAYGGEVKSLLSIGGDGALDRIGKKKPSRFKPVVMYAGPFYLKKGETARHKFTMPEYVGSVRTMVIAAEDGAYGSAEQTTKVRQPLMVLGTAPRVLGAGENFQLPITVFAMEDKIKDVEVTLTTNENLTINGRSTKNVPFSEPGDDIVYFDVTTAKRVGEASITVLVKSGSETAQYSMEIPIRHANQRETNVDEFALSKNNDWKTTYKPLGVLGTNSGVLEVSSVPPFNLGKRLKYLIRYPYGCVEQTTSSVFPQLYVSTLMELSEEQQAKIDKNIKAGIRRLQHFQNSDGGLGYWSGGRSNEWGTNYAGHFLIEAKRKGYSISNSLLNDLIGYQTKTAQAWSPKTDDNGYVRYYEELTQAYRLYGLALAGKPDLGSMNRLRVRKNNPEAVAARWYLAAAYHLAGQKGVAEKLVRQAKTATRRYAKASDNPTFGSRLRDQALIVQALSVMEDYDRAQELVKAISSRLSDQEWLNTQEVAHSLVALSEYSGRTKDGKTAEFEYRIAGGPWQKVSLKKPLWQLELNGDQAANIEMRTGRDGALFARLIADGIPEVGSETPLAEGLAIEVSYLNEQGKKLNPAKLSQGTDFKAIVTVKNTGKMNYSELALNQIFPSGWEIHNSRLLGSTEDAKADYIDIRDDRVYTFFNLNKGQQKTFTVLLNASYLGRYYLPSVSVAAMYDQSIQARVVGQWAEVLQPKEE